MIDSAEDTPFINCNTAINRNDIISRSVTKIASFLSTDSSAREREINKTDTMEKLSYLAPRQGRTVRPVRVFSQCQCCFTSTK